MVVWVAAALAAPSTPVVVIGDALTAPRDAAGFGEGARATAGWVAVAGDCLEERARGRYSVVDRTVPGETIDTAVARLAALLAPKPKVVVIALTGVGHPGKLAELVDEVAEVGAEVWLVGPLAGWAGLAVEPTFDKALADLGDKVHRVTLDGKVEDRGAARAGALTDAGHARLGAAVCSALVGR